MLTELLQSRLILNRARLGKILLAGGTPWPQRAQQLPPFHMKTTFHSPGHACLPSRWRAFVERWIENAQIQACELRRQTKSHFSTGPSHVKHRGMNVISSHAWQHIPTPCLAALTAFSESWWCKSGDSFTAWGLLSLLMQLLLQGL